MDTNIGNINMSTIMGIILMFIFWLMALNLGYKHEDLESWQIITQVIIQLILASVGIYLILS